MYHYYPGKQDLLVAILDDGLSEYFHLCDMELSQVGSSPEERLEALVAATIRFRVRHPAKSSIVNTEGRSLEPENVRWFQSQKHKASRLFEEVIEDGVASGVFRTPFPDDARRSVIATCNAVADWYDPDGGLTECAVIERNVTLAFAIVEYRPRTVICRPRSVD